MTQMTSRPIARFAASLALAGTLGLSGAAVTTAQDATPIGPGACLAPTTTAPIAATPAGAATMATPIEGETATGVAVEDEAIIAEATEAIQNINTCFNEGNGVAFAALFTDQGRVAAFGTDDATELAARMQVMSTMVQVGDLDVHEVIDHGDGSLGVDYQIMIGKQALHVTDTLINQNAAWLVDDRTVEMPETDLDSTTASVKTSVDGGSVVIEVSPNPIMNQPAVRLQVLNNADSAISMTLLQGGDAASVTEADLSSLPEGVTFVGDAHVASGQYVDTLFEGLEEGSYVIVAETANGETGSFDLTIDPPFDPNA